ncbi:MAG TPA: methyltransferase domain-containing protein [Ktedonobacterales bacterium]
MNDWFAQYYAEQYADSVRGALTPERSDKEGAFVIRQTRLQAPARILDLACGEGRHSLAFARRGFSVTGIDRNDGWIKKARAAAGTLDVTFIAGDMRLPVGADYDLVACLYHSFGFFADEENEALIRNWAATLKPGGWFALDVWNRDFKLVHWQPMWEWAPNAELHVREEYGFDPMTSRLAIHYTYTYANGGRYELDASHRLYTFTELRDLFARAGLVVGDVFGSLNGDSYSLESRRLVIFARKTE